MSSPGSNIPGMTNHPSLSPTLGRANITQLINSIKSAEPVPFADIDDLEPMDAYLTGYTQARAAALAEITLMWHAANIATAAVKAELERDLAEMLAAETDAEGAEE